MESPISTSPTMTKLKKTARELAEMIAARMTSRGVRLNIWGAPSDGTLWSMEGPLVALSRLKPK
jgi:hypothetical protein